MMMVVLPLLHRLTQRRPKLHQKPGNGAEERTVVEPGVAQKLEETLHAPGGPGRVDLQGESPHAALALH